MAQHPRPVGPTTNAIAVVDTAMVQGAQPWSDRAGTPVSRLIEEFTQPPDVSPFSQEMARGSTPDRARIFLAPRFLTPLAQTTHEEANFEPAMVQGAAPATHRVRTPVSRVIEEFAHAIDVSRFSQEMTQGAMPTRGRLFLAPRLLIPLAQPTHTEAAFSPDMVAGSLAQGGIVSRLSLGWIGQALDSPAFAFEMLIGPVAMTRRQAPVRPSWVTAQTTHVAAPFSPDMTWPAVGRRQTAQARRSDIAQVVDSVVFAAEMLLGQSGSRRQGWTLRVGQPVAQTTHVAAAFGQEMARGAQPAQPRVFLGPRIPLPDSQLTPVVVVFVGGTEAAAYVPRTWHSGRMAPSSRFVESVVLVSGTLGHNNLQPYVTVYIWRRIG